MVLSAGPPQGNLLGTTGRPEPGVTTTSISGIVYDSLAMHGLAGASVQIVDARRQASAHVVETDSAGRFSFADVPSGTYLLGYLHPKLDSLALSPPVLRVDVRTEEPIRVMLAVPSAHSIVRAYCGANAERDSTGLLIGFVRGADNSAPRPGATLGLRWAEIVIDRGGIRREVPSVRASASTTGLFAVCGVPVATPILLQAASASDSSGTFEATVPASGLLHRDVFVAPFTRATIAVSDSAPAVEVLRGTARLRGQIKGPSGRPVAGARVMVWGTGLETTSSEAGEFTLGALPGGTHTLEVRAVGFAPAQRPVDIVQGTPGSTDVELAMLGITLDTVRVVAQQLYTSQREADLERRMRTGLGHYFDDNDIEERHPFVVTDLLRTVPGVMVVPTAGSGETVLMRGGQGLGNGVCRPDVWFDGARVTIDQSFPLNSLVSPSDIRAIEVYAHAALVPPQFASFSGCGVVVIWTGPRRRR